MAGGFPEDFSAGEFEGGVAGVDGGAGAGLLEGGGLVDVEYETGGFEALAGFVGDPLLPDRV